MLDYEKITVTADTAGAGTATGTKHFIGELAGVKVLVGTAAATVDITIETVQSDSIVTLVTLTNVSASATYYPKHLVHTEAGAAMTGTAGGDRARPLVVGKIKVTVAQAGSGGSCSVIVFVDK